MVRPERHYRVQHKAWRTWEELDWIPYLLTDVVDAVEALPESELTVTRDLRPPAVIHTVRGTVFGIRFEIRGVRTTGGLWVEVMSVKPVDGEVPWNP